MTIRGRDGALERMRVWAASGQGTLPPDGITVQGHCVGAVGRAFLGRAAGFPTATAWADAARKAGILLTSTPAVRGDILLWTGGSHDYGHVGIAEDATWFYGVDRPTPGRVGRSRISRVWSSLTYAGRVRPEDMYRIGWPLIDPDPRPKPPAPHPRPVPIIDPKDDAMILRYVDPSSGRDTFWLLASGRITSVPRADAGTWTGPRMDVTDPGTWQTLRATYAPA